MTLTNNNVNYLIHLLACAINEKTPDPVPDNVDFNALFSLAEKHQIYNMIYPLIQDNPHISAEQKAKWRHSKMVETAKMVTVNSERAQIFEEFEKNQIKYMPLKGLILKNYYPKESMRQMSDNDILYDFSKRDIVCDIMKKRGYKTLATGENSDDFHKPPYCTFEFHRELFFKEHEFCPEFDNLWDNAKQDENSPFMYHMSLEDNYIYSVCHMYKHYSTAGCGVRFLADIYVVLKKDNDVLDWDYINSQLEIFGISEYEQKSRTLAFKLFDEKELDENDIALLETYINFGIYGSGKIKLQKELMSLADSGSLEKAKKKYIIKRLFPSVKKMKADYRVLEKKPYLLPAYYIYRLFRALFNRKKTMAEFKNINEIEEN